VGKHLTGSLVPHALRRRGARPVRTQPRLAIPGTHPVKGTSLADAVVKAVEQTIKNLQQANQSQSQGARK
jgi:hypothetical protein